MYTIDGRPIVKPNIVASNGIVHLIEGFLSPESDTIGARVERTSYYSTLQETLTRVGLLDVLLGIYYNFNSNISIKSYRSNLINS